MADRTVKSPMPEPVPDKDAPGRYAWTQRVDQVVRELAQMMARTATPDDVADAVAPLPTAAMVVSSAQTQASQVVARRVASAVNTQAVSVPGLGGMADVVLTLTPPLQSAEYVPVAGVPMTSTTTLLGLVTVAAVTARTTTSMTVKLKNTGATALTVPAGAITAVAIHAP